MSGGLAASGQGPLGGYLTGDEPLTDDEPPELVFSCPRCAEREFGAD
jgi:hypothetical protein